MVTWKILLFSIVTTLLSAPIVAQEAEHDHDHDHDHNKVPLEAIYIPLADHYPGVIAYEQYRD